MPMWLRKFTFKKIQDHYEQKAQQASGTSTDDMNEMRKTLQQAQQNRPSQPQQKSSPNVKVPDFVTTTKKASRK